MSLAQRLKQLDDRFVSERFDPPPHARYDARPPKREALFDRPPYQDWCVWLGIIACVFVAPRYAHLHRPLTFLNLLWLVPFQMAFWGALPAAIRRVLRRRRAAVGMANVQVPQPSRVIPSAGWYPDPFGAATLRYWDGRAWTGHLHATPPFDPAYLSQPGDGSVRSGRVPWWCSWAVIIVAECIFVVPAIVLVWLRPFTSRRTKWTATAVLVAIPVVATILDYALYP